MMTQQCLWRSADRCCALPVLQTPAQLHWAICANEEIARFMLVADALLASKDKVGLACTHNPHRLV
jgi:hypothetical protein